MIGTSIKMSGLREMQAALKELGRKAKPIVGKMLRGGAAVTAQRARAIAPVDTGKMRDAIEVTRVKTRKGRVKSSVSISSKGFTGFFYPRVIEKQRKFMLFAAEGSASSSAAEITRVGTQEIERAAKLAARKAARAKA